MIGQNPVNLFDLTNPANQAFASWLYVEEQQRQKDVITARHYHDGIQDTFLTARLREFLNAKGDHEFNLNICRTVVDVIVERLIIAGVDSDESGPTKPLAAWAAKTWTANNGALLHDSVHEGAVRDGEYFVIVDWDAASRRARFTPHQRYVDPTINGDGFGCKAHYPNDDAGANQPMLFASKRWVEYIDSVTTLRRMNLYYPDRIEKYRWQGSWTQHSDPADSGWPLPWLDRAGLPLGIPVIQFQNTGDLRPEAWDAIPMQKAINKALIDLLATGDMAAFQILVALGWIPTTDGEPLKADQSNAITFGPGQIIGTSRSKSEADFLAIPGADLRPVIETIISLLGWTAVITSTPASRFSFTKQVAAEGTLKEQNEGLFAKIRKRQKHLNQAWLQCFDLARRLENTFGSGGLSEDANVILRWEPIQARDTADERDEWTVKKALGVPTEQIWAEMGYTPEEIAGMKDTDEYKARLGLMQVGLNGGA